MRGKKRRFAWDNGDFIISNGDNVEKAVVAIAKSYASLRKFNPYHDSLGRFSSANGSASFTFAPGKSKAHDLAIQREKQRQAAADSAAKPKIKNNTAVAGHVGDYMDNAEAVVHTMETCGVTEDIAKEYVKAVDSYAQGLAYSMRHYQETGEGTDELPVAEAKAMSDHIENFITQSPKWGFTNGPLYRGIVVDQKTASQILQDFDDGAPIAMKGTSSWTSDKTVADEFGGNTWAGMTTFIFKIDGTSKGTSIRHLSEFDYQDEVLISKKAMWIGNILKKTGKNEYTIEMEEI